MIHGSEALYREMLEKLAQAHGRWRSEALCGFVGLKGSNYNSGLFVVGRAVNGWGQAWKADELLDGKRINRLVSDMFVDDFPLTWVSDQWGAKDKYNTRKSAFWRVIRKVVQGLSLANVEAASWPSYIAWSNLYKISPARGRNPSEALAQVQFSTTAKILEAEIRTLNPRHILFLTGLGWAEQFLKAVQFFPDLNVKPPIEASGHIFSGARVAVLPHPERKPEDPIVTAAVNCLSAA